MGRVRAEKAGAKGALAHFDGRVLGALRETETTLNTYAEDHNRHLALDAALEAARTAAEQARRLREAGAPTSAPIWAAVRCPRAEAAVVGSRHEIAMDQIELFLALGGGWGDEQQVTGDRQRTNRRPSPARKRPLLPRRRPPKPKEVSPTVPGAKGHALAPAPFRAGTIPLPCDWPHSCWQGAGQPLWRGQAGRRSGRAAGDRPCRARFPGWRWRGVVVAGPDVPPSPASRRSRSIRPARRCRAHWRKVSPRWDVDAVLVALADMPMVPPAHFAALVAAFDGDRIASQCARQVLPPAIFGAGHFAALRALSGIAARGPAARRARAGARSGPCARHRPPRRPRPRASPARRARLISIQASWSGQWIRPAGEAPRRRP
jgi:hypothetical protein